MRIIRDSPAELARELAGPYESTSKTRLSRRAKCNAVHAPNTPAPTTTTSNRSIASFLHQWPTLGPTQKARIKNPLKSYPIRPGEAPPVHPSTRSTLPSGAKEFSEHSHLNAC